MRNREMVLVMPFLSSLTLFSFTRMTSYVPMIYLGFCDFGESLAHLHL